MLKKLRKTLSKEFQKRYEKMESRFLGLENRIYTTIEERIENLEHKFEELSDLIKEEIRLRKERNEEKIEENDFAAFDDDNDGSMLSDKVEEVKEVIVDKIKEAKENVTEKAEAVSEKVQQAKELMTQTLKKAKKETQKVAEEVKEVVETAKEEVAETVENSKDDLTKIKGLGAKMAEKLLAEGITSFAQLADLTEEEVEALDEKIKSFAARFNRNDWGKQANDLK